MNARLNERPSCALLKSMLTGFMLACMSATLAGCRNIKPNISGSATPVHESPQGYAWGAVAHGGEAY